METVSFVGGNIHFFFPSRSTRTAHASPHDLKCPLYDTCVDEISSHNLHISGPTTVPFCILDSLTFFFTYFTIPQHVLHFNQAWRSFTSASTSDAPFLCTHMVAWRFGVYTHHWKPDGTGWHGATLLTFYSPCLFV